MGISSLKHIAERLFSSDPGATANPRNARTPQSAQIAQKLQEQDRNGGQVRNAEAGDRFTPSDDDVSARTGIAASRRERDGVPAATAHATPGAGAATHRAAAAGVSNPSPQKRG